MHSASHFARVRFAVAACALYLGLGLAAGRTCAYAMALDEDDGIGMFEPDGDDEDLSLEEDGPGQAAARLDLLEDSHLSVIEHWTHVRPSRVAEKDRDRAWRWAAARDGVSPLGPEPIHAFLRLPRAAEYRLSLRHRLSTQGARLVVLTLTPVGAKFEDAGAGITHRFGQVVLIADAAGRGQERRQPIRFETEAQLLGLPHKSMMVWEHFDARLEAGVYRASLQSTADVCCHSLFVSRCRAFRPSLSKSPTDRTLDCVYLRFRPVDGTAGGDYRVNASLTYHWRGRSSRRSGEPIWGYPVGATGPAPARGWSAFVDATDALVPGPGPWSTCRLRFDGLVRGEVDIQLAWHPHEAATQHTTRVRVEEGGAMLRLPHGAPRVHARADAAVWGMWPDGWLSLVQPESVLVERYFQWGREAADALALPADHPTPRRLRIISSCRLGPAWQARGVEMLAGLGVNWIEGADRESIERLGLHDAISGYNSTDAAGIARGLSPEDRSRYLKHKIGDEIGTHVEAETIRDDPELAARFGAYLRSRARARGMDLRSFLGTAETADLSSIDELPANASLYQRRLYYCSQRFAHLASVDEYRSITESFGRHFPRVRVYNNYSPHPVFLTGATMNHADWFVLCRNGAQTLSWGEDWATGGSWGLHTAYQCTSFYAALVECAGRARGCPSGFYVGVNCGGAARKIFSCVGQGLTWLHLYDWGPVDGWAEGSNAWSESKEQYAEVMRATHALGPADLIIDAGEREAPRTAILYNRSHEIWNAGLGRMNHDWLWTYIGLRSAQIPVDVVIEEDLNATDLARYRVVYLGGINLEQRHVAALAAWVEGGGLLIGTAGAASRNTANNEMPESIELFGARQKMISTPQTPRGAEPPATPRVVSDDSPLSPACSFDAPGLRFALSPTGAEVAARYDDGPPAAVVRRFGAGRTMLLGFQPGHAYRVAEKHTDEPRGDVRRWLVSPALHTLGRQMVEYADPDSEATAFVHESGIAVLLTSFGAGGARSQRLSVKTGRAVTAVTSGLRGALKWHKSEGRIEVDVPPLRPVDVVILHLRER